MTEDRNPTSDECLSWFKAQRVQKLDWLSKFSSGKAKRTDWEIDVKHYDQWILDYLILRQEQAIEARKSA
jgi:hypothetical protein